MQTNLFLCIQYKELDEADMVQLKYGDGRYAAAFAPRLHVFEKVDT